MSRVPRFLAALTVGAAVAFAQPVVSSIQNNYSGVLPGLPNYGIAQGSIFVIFGTNLAPASSGLQSAPLSAALNGVAVDFSVQGVTTHALLYYVMPGQVAGILPSATPLGTGTFTVTAAGQRSPPASLVVVQSAPGIAVSNGTVAFDANWMPVAAVNAANPGDVIVLYGTGAGPVAGDESVPPIPGNLDRIPFEIDIGGVPAQVTYHGRSTFPGLDQFNVVVPAGVQGCNTSVVARSGIYVGNFAYLPVAVGSRSCSDPSPGVQYEPVEYLTGRSSYKVATVVLDHSIVFEGPQYSSAGAIVPASSTDAYDASGTFTNVTPSPGTAVQVGNSQYVSPSLGSCLVTYSIGSSQTGAVQPADATASTLLNAGPALNFTGPNGKGSIQFQQYQPGTYAGTVANGAFIPSAGATLTIDNGSGGPDIGPFTTQFAVPPPLVWTNRSATTSVNRSQGLTVSWTGGNPTGWVWIEAQSFSPANPAIHVIVDCRVPNTAHQFTIPPSVLLSMPAEPPPTGPGPLSSLYVSDQSSVLFSPPGMDAGIIYTSTSIVMQVPFE